MKRPPHDARRRNRNIGTSRSGHGQLNKLTVPSPYGRVFWGIVPGAVSVVRRVRDLDLRFLVEPCHPDFVHAITIDDLTELLEYVPISEVEAIRLFVLRQPKRKESLLSPVWGRCVFDAQFESYSGPALIIDAQNPQAVLRWPKSLTPDAARELERLRAEGHLVTVARRHYAIRSPLEALRTTQLYRTVPHELGHYSHFRSEVIDPAESDDDKMLSLVEAYYNKPQQEREQFAERYAMQFNSQARRSGEIPFERRFDAASMKAEALKEEWFESTKPV